MVEEEVRRAAFKDDDLDVGIGLELIDDLDQALNALD